jgi:hypothetical protein
MRHVSDSYIALFSHFIPCGVWEAVYIIEGLLKNDSDIQPDTIHADTQGQSLPVFRLAALLGFELLPRIRNWKDLNFYRPDAGARYQHIDVLFGDNTIDWGLIERHWTDLLRTAISIREGRVSSVTLLRRLENHSRKNQLYRAFRELGCVIRTITLLRFLSEPQLREQIDAMTNKAEAFHGYSEWLMASGKLIGRNDLLDQLDQVQRMRDLLHRAGHHRRGQHLGCRGPPSRPRRPGHHHALHHPHHPPPGRPGARPRPARRDPHHPPGPGTPRPVPRRTRRLTSRSQAEPRPCAGGHGHRRLTPAQQKSVVGLAWAVRCPLVGVAAAICEVG